MDDEIITITIKGADHYFNGDELTSPIHDAIAFLNELLEQEMVI